MIGDQAVRGNDLESITKDLEIGLKLEFEYSLVFAVNGNDTHILGFIRVLNYSVNEAVRDTIICGILWVFDAIRLEMQLVITEIEMPNVFTFLQFTYFRPKLGNLLW